jgi:hypothetical protein
LTFLQCIVIILFQIFYWRLFMNKVTKLAVLSVIAAQLVFSGAVSAVSTAGVLTVQGVIAATETSALSSVTAGDLDLATSLAVGGPTSKRATLTLGSNGARGFDLSVVSVRKFVMEHTTSALVTKPSIAYNLVLVRTAAGTNFPAFVGANPTNVIAGATDVTTAMSNASGLSINSASAFLSGAGATVLMFRTSAAGTGASAGPVSGLTYDVKVTYTGNATLPAGTYADTVTFQLTNAD